jgi:hypothetical protein
VLYICKTKAINMTTQQILNSNANEVRVMAINFARTNNYNVADKYNELNNAWFALMSEIHANGKEGNYDGAMLLQTATQTLQAWA